MPNILFLGVGGAGMNILSDPRLAVAGRCVAVNTDAERLRSFSITEKLQVGQGTCSGSSAVSPVRGEQAARESLQQLEALLQPDLDGFFVIAGLGGGTGTGVLPVLVELAKAKAIPFAAAVTLPPVISGSQRDTALKALSDLQVKEIDAFVVDLEEMLAAWKEPKGWCGSLNDLTKLEPTSFSVREYSRGNMKRHLECSSQLKGNSKFMQFFTQLQKQLGEHVTSPRNAVFWGNVFCVSLNKSSPVKAKHFKRLMEISQRLLAIQFEVLQPHVVLFVSGWKYDNYIKPIMPTRQPLLGLIKKEFWPFETPHFTAYRVPHPRRHTKELRNKVLREVRLHLDHMAAQKAV